MKSNGTTNIYRRFLPKEKFNAYPGHRICLGDNILYLLQHINFSIGEQYSILVKEYSSISEITNVSIYALIEAVGEDHSCKDFVHQNLHEKLAGAAKEIGLDQTTTFFKTLGSVIYKAFDDLDTEYMYLFP